MYFGAPAVVGMGGTLIAVRQRFHPVWPAAASLLVAAVGAAARVQAGRTAVPGGFGHIRMNFALATSGQGIAQSAIHVLVILWVAMLPYLIWRLREATSATARWSPWKLALASRLASRKVNERHDGACKDEHQR
jgi:hypothetical protein